MEVLFEINGETEKGIAVKEYVTEEKVEVLVISKKNKNSFLIKKDELVYAE